MRQKDPFLTGEVTAMSNRFSLEGQLMPELWRPVEGNPNAIEVNLAAAPLVPFSRAEVAWHWGRKRGWVRVELRDGKLRVKDCEVTLYLDPHQDGGGLRGDRLYKNFEATSLNSLVLHPNIRTALRMNLRLFPESWKTDGRGRPVVVAYWAMGFKGATGGQCVEASTFRDGEWSGLYIWLDSYFRGTNPAAMRSVLEAS